MTPVARVALLAEFDRELRAWCISALLREECVQAARDMPEAQLTHVLGALRSARHDPATRPDVFDVIIAALDDARTPPTLADRASQAVIDVIRTRTDDIDAEYAARQPQRTTGLA